MTLCSNAIETNRVKFHFDDSLGSNLMVQEIKRCFAHPLEQLNRLLDGSHNGPATNATNAATSSTDP